MNRSMSNRYNTRQPWSGWAALLLAALLAACGGGEPTAEPPPPPKATLDYLTRFYTVMIDSETEGPYLYHSPYTDRMEFVDGLGVIDHTVDLNPELTGGVSANASLITRVPGETGLKSSVYSNADGTTYWVEAQAPHPTDNNRHATAALAGLELDYYYRKDSPDATLSAVITDVILEGLSYVNPVALGEGVCPYQAPECVGGNDEIYTGMTISVMDEAGKLLLRYRSVSTLYLGMQSWRAETRNSQSGKNIWTEAQMEFNPDAGNAAAGMVHGTHATYKLKAPVVHDIPLANVPERFWVNVVVSAYASNASRNEEPYRAAFFRDPLKAGAPDSGAKFQHQGLTALKPPGPRPAEQPVDACTGAPDPLAGTLQFQVSDLHAVEIGASRLRVKVTRTGGTQGAVSVDLTSANGTAMAGADYQAVNQTLRFEDGESGPFEAEVLALEDDAVETDEAFTLALGNVRGCAALGAATTATVTIHDLDRATYTLGGTVSGLVGSGLFVRSNGFDVRVDASGPFTLPSRFASGTVYNLDVEVQPSNPLQVCRVTNGQGTIVNANITELAVVCDPPAPPPAGGALDPGFAGGMVSNPSHGRILSMALQPDGRIVVLTDFNKLLRYQVDGTLDTSFGSNGVVSATLGGNALDLLRAVVVQADGGILVAGMARASGGSTTAEDMGVKRYLPNGAMDNAFGTAGFVRVDIAGRSDDAVAMAVQPDGKIVLGGLALVTAVGASDFALARLDANGVLDAGFGSSGKLTVNAGGALDIAAAMTLRADGAIVLVGRTATGGGATPDTGVVRVSASGVVELALKLPLTADWDEATGVAIQPDGKIVLALEARADAAGQYQHALARLKPDGKLDESFGTLGVALAGFSVGGDHARAPVLLADGRIVTAGFARNQVQQLSDKDDFLITRHLSDGTLDASFGSGGKLIVDFYGGADGASALLLQPDGKLLVGGLARSGTANGLGLLRLLP